jgi:hypothetical protein
VDNEEWEADYHDLKRSSRNTYGTGTCGVPVKFKQLRNFSFDILPKSTKGQGQGNEGSPDDNERHQQHPQRHRLPIVNSHSLGRVLASAETQLSDPPVFFFAAMPPKRTPQKSVNKKQSEAASARKTRFCARTQLAAKTADLGEICPDGSVEAVKTAEEGSQIQPEPDPSGSRGGHAGVKAQTGATVAPSQRLTTSPRKKGRFDQKSPDRHTGELHVLPGHGMEDVGRGNNGEENNLASCSFGSDTEYLAETYVLINSEVDQNGSLQQRVFCNQELLRRLRRHWMNSLWNVRCSFRSLLGTSWPGEQSFQIMIEDLLKHRETSQNNKPPLVLSADVPRLKHIAHKRMGYLRATYRLFKDTVSVTEKYSIALVKLHMTMCVKHYHTLIPQLDLIGTQWGVDIEDTLFYDDLISPQKLASNHRVKAASARKTRY